MIVSTTLVFSRAISASMDDFLSMFQRLPVLRPARALRPLVSLRRPRYFRRPRRHGTTRHPGSDLLRRGHGRLARATHHRLYLDRSHTHVVGFPLQERGDENEAVSRESRGHGLESCTNRV